MIIDYEKVTGASDYQTVKATKAAIDGMSYQVLNRYVSDATLQAAIDWVKSYRQYLLMFAGDDLELWREEVTWTRERYEYLTTYRTVHR